MLPLINPSNRPLVSVVMPVYNAEKFIHEAIVSVLSQTYENIEIIIVNDGSTDGSEAVVKSFKTPNLRYFSTENQGPASARNFGIKNSRGDLITFLDADDIFPIDKVELQVNRLVQNPELEFVSGRVQYLDPENTLTDKFLFEDFEKKTIISVHLGAMMCRKHVFDQNDTGLFNEDLLHAEDVDWWLKAMEKRKVFRILSDTTLIYRIHSNNMTKDSSTNRSFFIKTLRSSLVRRRQAGNFDISKLSEHADPAKSQNPLVSIIVVAVSDAQDISKSLNSIRLQNYHPLEILLVDTSGKQQSEALKDDVRYYPAPGKTKFEALYNALKASKGDFVAFSTIHLKWDSSKVKIQAAELIRNPGMLYCLSTVSTGFRKSEDAGRPESEFSDLFLADGLLARKQLFEGGKQHFSESKFIEFMTKLSKGEAEGRPRIIEKTLASSF